MTLLRRLDDVPSAVRDTERALEYFCDVAGLEVVSSEERTVPSVPLTYLDTGNALVQLVEPLDADNPVAASL